MNAPDAAELRPGDSVKLRNTLNPVHNGTRAIVVAVHLDPEHRGEVASVEVRYSARGSAIRVPLDGPGDLVRWADRWPAGPSPAAQPPVEEERVVAELTGPSRRRAALVAAAIVLPVAGVLAWQTLAPATRGERHFAAATDRVVTGGGLVVGATDPGAGGPTGSPLTPSTPTQAPPTGEVVAYAGGGAAPLPVLSADGAQPRPRPLAGVEALPGCGDAFAAELLRVLPVGTGVAVRDAGAAAWVTTEGGVDVNAALVRAGVAEPVDVAGGSAGDATAVAALRAQAPAAPAAC